LKRYYSKKSAVKFAWKNYVIYKNYMRNLFLLQAYFFKITILIVFLMIFVKNPVLGGPRCPPPGGIGGK
jgi:hypothetical protein